MRFKRLIAALASGALAVSGTAAAGLSDVQPLKAEAARTKYTPQTEPSKF